MKKPLIALLALLTVPAFASTGNVEESDGSAAFLLQYLLYPEQNKIGGSEQIPVCFAEFRSLTSGIEYVSKLTGAEDGESDYTYQITGTVKEDSPHREVVMYVNHGEGSVDCEVETY